MHIDDEKEEENEEDKLFAHIDYISMNFHFIFVCLCVCSQLPIGNKSCSYYMILLQYHKPYCIRLGNIYILNGMENADKFIC